MKVAASNRDALTIVHVARLSDAIRRLKQNNFQAVMVELDLPDAKGLEALRSLTGAAPHLPILVLGDVTVLQQMKMVEHGAHDYLLKHRLGADTLMRALHGSITCIARAPTQSKPVDSGECRSLLSLGQQRWPWRFPSPPPRALS